MKIPYEVIHSKDPKKPGYKVLCPGGTIANQTVMTEEQARVHCERLIALRLDLPRKHKSD